jgi:hypothetical protein
VDAAPARESETPSLEKAIKQKRHEQRKARRKAGAS